MQQKARGGGAERGQRRRAGAGARQGPGGPPARRDRAVGHAQQHEPPPAPSRPRVKRRPARPCRRRRARPSRPGPTKTMSNAGTPPEDGVLRTIAHVGCVRRGTAMETATAGAADRAGGPVRFGCMPIYEYTCAACEHRFEELVLASPHARRLPRVHVLYVEKLLSVFARAGVGGDMPPPRWRRGRRLLWRRLRLPPGRASRPLLPTSTPGRGLHRLRALGVAHEVVVGAGRSSGLMLVGDAPGLLDDRRACRLSARPAPCSTSCWPRRAARAQATSRTSSSAARRAAATPRGRVAACRESSSPDRAGAPARRLHARELRDARAVGPPHRHRARPGQARRPTRGDLGTVLAAASPRAAL